MKVNYTGVVGSIILINSCILSMDNQGFTFIVNYDDSTPSPSKHDFEAVMFGTPKGRGAPLLTEEERLQFVNIHSNAEVLERNTPLHSESESEIARSFPSSELMFSLDDLDAATHSPVTPRPSSKNSVSELAKKTTTIKKILQKDPLEIDQNITLFEAITITENYTP